jgi:hypothetical protein
MNKAGKTRAGAGAKARAATAKATRDRQPAGTKLVELKRHLLEISNLAAARSVLRWDQATYMPRGGAHARARQGATLSRLAHENPSMRHWANCLTNLRHTPLACLMIRMRPDTDRPPRLREGHQATQRLCLAARSARPLMMPGRGRGRRTTLRPKKLRHRFGKRTGASIFPPAD